MTHWRDTKLPGVGTTIFTRISRQAKELGAINLSQGFPDFMPDQHLLDLTHQAMLEGANQYAPLAGVPELLQVIHEHLRTTYDVNYDPQNEITITAGATQAIYTALSTLVYPGDEVLFFEPVFDSYRPAILTHLGVPVPIVLDPPFEALDWDQVRSVITKRTRGVIINSPHNPSGYVWTDADYRELEQIAQQYDLWVISDEVYEHLVYDGAHHLTALAYEGLRDRCLTCFSFGKSLHVTGWKIGYIVATATLTARFRQVHQFTVFVVNHPAQAGIAKYVAMHHPFKQLAPFFEQKRNLLMKQLDPTPFKVIPTQGTYFMVADYRAIRDIPDEEFVSWLMESYGIATIPLSAFYSAPNDLRLVRFCFAKKEETLLEAGRRLRALG